MKHFLACAARQAGFAVSVILVLCLQVLISGNAAAQTEGDAKASLQDLLNASIETILGVTEWPCEFAGSFTQQRSLAGTNTLIRSSGEFFYSCAHGLLWEVRKPIAESVVYTYAGSHLRIRPGGATRELNGVVQKRIAGLLLGLLGGDAASLEQDFKLSLESTLPELIRLLPHRLALRQQIEAIELIDDQQSITVRIISATSGDMQIRIDKLRLHDTLPVVACASFSAQADIACQHLFNKK